MSLNSVLKKQLLICSWFFFCRNRKSSVTFTLCTFEESLLQKCPFSEVEISLSFFFLVVLFIKNKIQQEHHSAKCSFCAVAKDQSCCSQTDVRKRCCLALTTSPWWGCSLRGLNRRQVPCKGSHVQSLHRVSLMAGRSPCTGPAEASRELSQMFLDERCAWWSQTKARTTFFEVLKTD